MRYIGSKINLLTEISDILEDKLDGDEETFLDLFAGTHSVGVYFKSKYTVFSNDTLALSYVGGMCKIEGAEKVTFHNLHSYGIERPLEYLNHNADLHLVEQLVPGYYEEAYSPAGDAMYLSTKNARRLDFIRNKIEEWYGKSQINQYEYCYLLSCLIEAISRVSNTTGTYGAFLKYWDKRALNPMRLEPIELTVNGRKNRCFNMDACDLARQIEADIAYIDPPYNSRQYASNYHVLENVVRNQKPSLHGRTKIFEWGSLKSSYASKMYATEAFKNLLSVIKCDHIVFSYNSEGILSIDELVNLVSEYAINGTVDVKYLQYRKYKSKKPSKRDKVKEVLIYARMGRTRSAKLSKQITNRKSGPEIGLVKSPFNYIGGKFRLLPQILPLFPNDIATFVDLFSGGANVGINVSADCHIFNDMNSSLNSIFRLLQDTPVDDLLREIHNRISLWGLSKTNETAFYELRKHYNRTKDPLDLYILTAYSYNYQLRFNNNMEYNNPFGRSRSHFSARMEDNLVAFTKRLQGMRADFSDFYFQDFPMSILKPSDFVYLDPPYLITTGSYNDGNRGFRNWGAHEERTLFQFMDRLDEKGIRFALSNVTHHKGKVNELLLDYLENRNYEIHEMVYDYDNSSHNSKAKGSTEVLITNY